MTKRCVIQWCLYDTNLDLKNYTCHWISVTCLLQYADIYVLPYLLAKYQRIVTLFRCLFIGYEPHTDPCCHWWATFPHYKVYLPTNAVTDEPPFHTTKSTYRPMLSLMSHRSTLQSLLTNPCCHWWATVPHNKVYLPTNAVTDEPPFHTTKSTYQPMLSLMSHRSTLQRRP